MIQSSSSIELHETDAAQKNHSCQRKSEVPFTWSKVVSTSNRDTTELISPNYDWGKHF